MIFRKKPLDFNPNQKINYNENDLLDELHVRFFQSFAVTLDVADYVPQKYIEKVYKQIYKALKRRYKKIAKTNKAYQKWFNAHFIPLKPEGQVQPALLQNEEGATNEQEQQSE